MESTEPSLEKFREQYRSKIPRYYIGWVHFMMTTVIAFSMIITGILMLDNVQDIEWITVPLAFLYTNLIEYLGHKGPMHHQKKYLKLIYKRHSKEHHVFFTDQHMRFGNSRDYIAVLFPIPLILFFFGLIGVPSWFLISWLFTANIAWLFVITSVAYFINYEWLHFAYHCADDAWINKVPGFKRLKKLHTHHHNQKLMAHYNFNITYPICDKLFGTYYKESKYNNDDK